MMTLQLIPENENRLSSFATRYLGIDFTSNNGIKPCKVSFSAKKTREDIKNLQKELRSKLNFFQQNENLILQNPEDTQYNITKQLCEIMKYLENLKSFRKQERYINTYPHFTTKIDKIDIHFIYVKPDCTDKYVVPLLMLHGWPSSVIEFYNIIPLLTAQREASNFVFEVIVPSLPGFGFSGVPKKQDDDLTCESIGDILIKLMKKLNRNQFYIHCDDWSSLIAATMAMNHPENILGVHYVLCHVTHWLSLSEYLLETINRRNALEKDSIQLTHKYDKISPSTSINTLLLSLMNSPVSLLAYMLDKLLNGSRNPHKVSILKYGYSAFFSNILMHCPTNNICNSLQAYYRYHKFNYYMDLIVTKDIFTAVTFILPEELKTIEENIVEKENKTFSFIYKFTSRFPACEDSMEMASAIVDHFKKHLVVGQANQE